MVDACDENKFLQVQKSLIEVLNFDESKGLPILILANKSDKIEDSPLTSEQLAEAMSIRQLCRKRVICIQRTSTKTGDGLENALERVRAMVGQSERIFGGKRDEKSEKSGKNEKSGKTEKSGENEKIGENKKIVDKSGVDGKKVVSPKKILRSEGKFNHLKKKQGKRLSLMASISYDSPPPPGNNTKTPIDTLTSEKSENNENSKNSQNSEKTESKPDITKTDHTITTSTLSSPSPSSSTTSSSSPSSSSSTLSTTHCWDNTLKSANSGNYRLARAKNYYNQQPQHRSMIVHNEVTKKVKLQPVSAVRSVIAVEKLEMEKNSGNRQRGRSGTRKAGADVGKKNIGEKLYFSGKSDENGLESGKSGKSEKSGNSGNSENSKSSEKSKKPEKSENSTKSRQNQLSHTLQINTKHTKNAKHSAETSHNRSLGSCGNSCNSSLSSEESVKNNQNHALNQDLTEINQEDTLRRLIRRRRSMLTTSYIGSYTNSLPKTRESKNCVKPPAPPRRSTSRVGQRKNLVIRVERELIEQNL